MKFSTSTAIRSGFEWNELDLCKVIGMNCEFLVLCSEVKIPYSPVEVSEARQWICARLHGDAFQTGKETKL
jgi:hypothetical protein